jgi:hypothetical protein
MAGSTRSSTSYGFRDSFEWQVYAAAELEALGCRVGVRPVIAACGFDKSRVPRGESPRMQIVFER